MSQIKKKNSSILIVYKGGVFSSFIGVIDLLFILI